MNPISIPQLPAKQQVQLAVRLYLERAYARFPPELLERFSPPEDADLASWLMRDEVERLPEHAGVAEVEAWARESWKATVRSQVLPALAARGARVKADEAEDVQAIRKAFDHALPTTGWHPPSCSPTPTSWSSPSSEWQAPPKGSMRPATLWTASHASSFALSSLRLWSGPNL